MKRNITPFYIDGPVESVDCSAGNQTISGKSSFVLVTGPSSGTPATLNLPVRTSDDRPIAPGTMVTMVRTDSDSDSVNVSSESALDTNSSSTLSAYLDSASFMFVGPNNDNIFGSWTLISSDLAAADWNGGTVTENTTFTKKVTIEGNTEVGNAATDLLKISSKTYYTNNNFANNQPSVVATSTSGEADVSDLSSQNAGIIEFTGVWANADTAVVTFPQDFPTESHYMVFSNQDSGVNGSITSVTNQGFTFTASGTCVGNLEYFVVVTGKG